MYNGGNELRECLANAKGQRCDHLRRRLNKLRQQGQQAVCQFQNDCDRCTGNLRHGRNNPVCQSHNNIHASVQQGGKAGKYRLPDSRNNGGYLFQQNLDQTAQALREGFCGASRSFQNTLQALAHEGHKREHGLQYVCRHEFQRCHNRLRNSAQLRVGIGQFRLRPLGLHHITVKLFVIFRSLLIQPVQGIGNEGRPFLLAVAGIQRSLKSVLGNTGPVQRVGKGTGDLACLGGFVGRLGQALNGEAVAKGGPYASGNVRPLRQLLLGVAQLGKVVDRFNTSIFLAKNGIKGFIGFAGLLGGKTGSNKSRIQLGLILPVFPCRLRKIEKTLGKPGKGSARSNYRRANRHTHAFDYRADLIKLGGGVIRILGRAFQFIPEVVRLIAGLLQFIPQLVDGPLILRQLPLHTVQGGLRIIKLRLPLLCAPVIFPKGICGIFQRLLQGADFLPLGINFLIEDAVPGGKGFHGFILLIKL